MPTPIPPLLHMNGTSVESLLEEHEASCRTLRAALEALPVPNARDFYVSGDGAFERARAEHEARIAALRGVLAQVEWLMEAIVEQQDARGAQRS